MAQKLTAKQEAPPLSHAKKAAFLAALSETGNVSKAAEASGINRRSHSRWLQEDDEYRVATAEALDAAADKLEEEARRRAHDGFDEPVYYQGEVCGTVRKYSDTLLIFLLKGARPDKYRERTSITVEDPVKALAKLLNVKPEEIPC